MKSWKYLRQYEKGNWPDIAQEGYIKGCEFIDDGVQGTLKIKLKYGPNGEKVISGLKKISKPGLRVYARHDKLPRVLNGSDRDHLHIQGHRDRQRRRAATVGGEVLAISGSWRLNIMSRIGKLPIDLPSGVTVTQDGGIVTVKGKNGELQSKFSDKITITQEGEQLVLT